MRVLVTGASGLLGGYLLREANARGLDVVGWPGPLSRLGSQLYSRAGDLGEPRWVAAAFGEVKPDLLIHARALASIEPCRRDPDKARRVNTVGTGLLADIAAKARIRMVHISTDLVFDGENAPYRESDVPSPLSVYGRTKRDAEVAVLVRPRHVVARLSLLFGPTLTSRVGFFDQQLAALRAGSRLSLFEDEWRTPLSLAAAGRALVSLALSDFTGMIHIGGPERMSRLEMGKRLAAYLNLDGAGFIPARRDSVACAEPRPRDTSLDSSLWHSLFPQGAWPMFEDAICEM